MIEKEISKDAPLLWCIAKKSLSVTKKVGIAVAVIFMIAVAGYILINIIPPLVSMVVAVLLSVPLPVIAVVGTGIAIVIYSTGWCITRKF